jgi:NADPH:quinone reductase-like Zn-dependent oxidoreductase
VGKFKESDVLVVSGAAGAVGMVVGQIAKHVLKCKKVTRGERGRGRERERRAQGISAPLADGQERRVTKFRKITEFNLENR